jgi:multicomponent Na+:H+ antiporter subunit F
MDNILLEIAIGITLLSMVMSMYRFIKGPHKVDRIITLDVLTVSSIALISFIAALLDKMIYLDVALVYGILGFLGVIIVAKYLEKGL